ncbi:MAG: FHA domain-containing protein [Planctomycetaceae bacterium]|nr:FHA domain-containing protein [Planctomycetaceae bacterium]
MPIFLIPLDGGDDVPLDKAVTFVGRHPDCDIVLTNSRKVSRKHCCIAQINEAYVVRDLGSMNGVRVNDDISHEEMRIRPGDQLWVGDVGFRVEFRSAQPKQRKSEDRTNDGDGTTAGSPAASASPLRSAKLDRRFISQDIPVAIPEEGADLIVENTQPRMKRPAPQANPEVIELSNEDLFDDDTTRRSGR